MNFPEFGEVVKQKENEFPEYGSVVKEEVSRPRSLAGAPVKGAIKGALDIAAIADPFKALLGVNELNPMQQKALEKILPTQDNPIEKGLERAGRIGVAALGGPESLLAKGTRTVAAATLGQTAEEMGAPQWVQNLAELLAFVAPKPSKNLVANKSQKEAVNFLRSKGLSDKEITPLIQSERKMRSLSGLAAKGPKTEKLSADISQRLGENYDLLKERGARSFLSGDEAVKFDDKLIGGMDKISKGFRRLIEKDVEDLRNSGISAKSLIDFYQDINRIVKGQQGGKAVLSTLKPIVLEGLEKANPEIAKDYTLLNEFYRKNKTLMSSLKQSNLDKFFKGAKSFGALASAVTGNFSFLPKLLGVEGAQVAARELLINPRLQNISKQILTAIKNNEVPVALRSLKILSKEFEKINPELKFEENEE